MSKKKLGSAGENQPIHQRMKTELLLKTSLCIMRFAFPVRTYQRHKMFKSFPITARLENTTEKNCTNDEPNLQVCEIINALEKVLNR